LAGLALGLAAGSCDSPEARVRAALDPLPVREYERAEERARMVEQQIAARGVSDPRVLAALRAVPRHLCVPEEMRPYAYRDHALPIGKEQTISQPYIVAFMTEALELEGGERVLEVGTGSGYQAAVLVWAGCEVWSIEIVPSLAERARKLLLEELELPNLHLRTGDGYRGWPEVAPFDAIIVTAAPDHVPPALIEQLAPGAPLVIPVGGDRQDLRRLRKDSEGVVEEHLLPVRFVPMTGEAQER